MKYSIVTDLSIVLSFPNIVKHRLHVCLDVAGLRVPRHLLDEEVVVPVPDVLVLDGDLPPLAAHRVAPHLLRGGGGGGGRLGLGHLAALLWGAGGGLAVLPACQR